jgi:hypothetical protein
LPLTRRTLLRCAQHERQHDRQRAKRNQLTTDNAAKPQRPNARSA